MMTNTKLNRVAVRLILTTYIIGMLASSNRNSTVVHSQEQVKVKIASTAIAQLQLRATQNANSSRHRLANFSGKRKTKPLPVYHPSVSMVLTLMFLAGDIECNPGPVKYPCLI